MQAVRRSCQLVQQLRVEFVSSSDHFQSMNSSQQQPDSAKDRYWKQSLYVVCLILGIWAFISLGCGVLFREFLDKAMPKVGNAPFGFWMAQQGAIIGFLVLLFIYMVVMNGLDRRHGFGEEDSE